MISREEAIEECETKYETDIVNKIFDSIGSCDDCIYRDSKENYCGVVSRKVLDDWYCGYFERKQDDTVEIIN